MADTLTDDQISFPTSFCGEDSQNLNRLAQQLSNVINNISNTVNVLTGGGGDGAIFRFRLTADLTLPPAAGSGSAVAVILAFDGSAYSSIGVGTVFDEEPGGVWQGTAGDEGWCTARSGQPGAYSIIVMAPKNAAGSDVQQSYIDLFNSLLANALNPAPPAVEYFSRNMDGWKTPGTHAIGDELDTTHLEGYLGASSYFGVEANVGISHDHGEPNPSTEGNWVVAASGLYRISLWGELSTHVNDTTTNFGLSETLTTSGPSAGAAHTHTLDIIKSDPLFATDSLTVTLRRKPSGQAIDDFQDDLGSTRKFFRQYNTTTQKLVVAIEWDVKLQTDDRVTFRFQVAVGNIILGLLAGGIRIRFEYLGNGLNGTVPIVWTAF